MFKLETDELDYYKEGNSVYILPRIECTGLFDYFSYCLKYKNVGKELLHLPIYIKKGLQEGAGRIEQRTKGLEYVNNWLSKYLGEEVFSVKKHIDEQLIEIPLGLYTLYHLGEIIFNYDDEIRNEGNDMVDKLLKGTHYILKAINSTGEQGVKYFVNKDKKEYENQKRDFMDPIFSNIYLFNILKGTNKKRINIDKYIKIGCGRIDGLANKTTYSYQTHAEFSKEYQTIQEGYSNTIEKTNQQYLGDGFEFITENNNLVNLGYILFNELVIGNTTTYIYGDFLCYFDEDAHNGEGDIIDGCYHIIQRDYLPEYMEHNSKVTCINPLTITLRNECKPFIDQLSSIQILKKEIGKECNISGSQIKTIVEEIKNIGRYTDNAKITIEIQDKKS